jgi:hypothetical protein
MKLTGPQMDQAITAIRQAFELPGLKRVVKIHLDWDLDDITLAMTKEDRVFELVDWAMRVGGILKLFEGLKAAAPGNAALCHTLNQIMGIESPAVGPPANPFDVLIAFEEPIIDREDLRTELKRLFEDPAYSTLIVDGPRYSGRSHTWLLVRYIALERGITPFYLDVSQNPAAWPIDRVAFALLKCFGLTKDKLPDPLAQGSRLALGFGDLLLSESPSFAVQGRRWCIVIDGLDRAGIDEAVYELVNRLISDATNLSIPNVSLVLLGKGPSIKHNLSHRILREQVQQFGKTDVTSYLVAIAASHGRTVANEGLQEQVASIFRDLNPPLDFDSMLELKTRIWKNGVEPIKASLWAKYLSNSSRSRLSGCAKILRTPS